MHFSQNKLALKAAGGATGFPMTLSCLQLGVGVIYALFLWAAPDARKLPEVTTSDVIKMLPVGICAAGAHAGSVCKLFPSKPLSGCVDYADDQSLSVPGPSRSPKL